MSFRFWLSIAIAMCAMLVTVTAVTTNIQGRIIGGSEAHIVRFPYQVSIRRKSCATCAFEQFASGAIYSKNIIITSAGAIRTDTAESLMIVAGTSYRTASNGMLFPVEEIIIHENFQSLSFDNDIALLKLKIDIPMTESTIVQALKIADAEPVVGSIGVIAGWGQTSEIGGYSETLQYASIPIVSRQSCQNLYQFNTITENMICAGVMDGGVDACKGDAGSPLVVANELVGLVSWGIGCARPNQPGVYTNLVQLRAWIDAAVKDYSVK